MKAESIIAKFGDKLKQMAIDSYMKIPDLIKDVPFMKVSEIVTDGNPEIVLRCPICETDISTNSYTLNECPSCGHKRLFPTGRSTWYSHSYAELKETLSLSTSRVNVAFLDEKQDLILGEYDVYAKYSVPEKTLSIGEAYLRCIGYFREDNFDFFQARGGTYSRRRNGRDMSTSFRTSSRYYPYSAVPDPPEATKEWCKKHKVSDGTDVARYYENRKAARTSACNLDMSKMDPLDSKSIVEQMRKRMIVKVSQTVDKVKKHSRTFCYCCRCESEFLEERDDLSFYGDVKCPSCGMTSEAVSASETSMYRFSERPVALIQQYEGDTVKKGILYRVLNGKLTCYLDANNVPILQLEDQYEYCVLFDLSSKRFTAYDTVDGMGYAPCQANETRCVVPQIDAKSGTPAAYCAADVVAAGSWCGVLREVELRKYLELYARSPVVEKLAKGGYAGLIYEIIRDSRTSPIYVWAKDAFKDAKSIEDAFSLPKHIVKGTKALLNRGEKTIKNVRAIYALDNTASAEDIVYLIDNECDVLSIGQILNMLGTNIKRIVEYIEGVRVHQCCPPKISTNLWCDYLKTCITVGTDINDKRVRYPNSLKREHDKVIARMSFIRDDELEQKFAEQVTRCQDKFGGRSGRFEIRAPKSMQELFEEGRLLSHSVGSYSDVISKGDTCIMFLRDLTSPETPYLTLEIDEINETVPQIRGFSNRLVDEEDESDAVEFVVAWAYKRKLDVSNVLKTARNVLKRLKDSGKIYRILENDKEDTPEESESSVV